VGGFSRTMAQITRNHARRCFWGSAQWPTRFRGSNFPKKRQKGPS